MRLLNYLNRNSGGAWQVVLVTDEGAFYKLLQNQSVNLLLMSEGQACDRSHLQAVLTEREIAVVTLSEQRVKSADCIFRYDCAKTILDCVRARLCGEELRSVVCEDALVAVIPVLDDRSVRSSLRRLAEKRHALYWELTAFSDDAHNERADALWYAVKMRDEMYFAGQDVFRLGEEGGLAVASVNLMYDYRELGVADVEWFVSRVRACGIAEIYVLLNPSVLGARELLYAFSKIWVVGAPEYEEREEAVWRFLELANVDMSRVEKHSKTEWNSAC
jgi:hypothetical protein